MSRIGFIGLGHMGLPMASNLLQKGHEVIVYDIVPEAIQALVAQGAIAANRVAEMAAKVEIIFTMLQTGEQVRDVCLGSEGIFANLTPGSLYIDSSSIDVSTSRALHQAAKSQEIQMLDAPVSGGVAGAKAGTLTMMVGGDEESYQRALPVLECLGQKIIYAGPAGNGQVAKICNNMILGISMIAISEAFILAEKLGLAPQKFFEIANNSSGQCWSLSKYCPVPGILENVPSNNHYVPGFTASMMLKDLRLSQEAALQANIVTPLGAQATAIYSQFVNQGYANLDFSGIINVIQ